MYSFYYSLSQLFSCLAKLQCILWVIGHIEGGISWGDGLNDDRNEYEEDLKKKIKSTLQYIKFHVVDDTKLNQSSASYADGRLQTGIY